MSGRRRQKQAMAGIGLAVAVFIAGLVSVVLDGRPSAYDAPPNSLTPRLVASPERVAEITISTASETFTLRRTLEGWALISHDGYVADADLADQLVSAVVSFEPIGERTERPDQYARLNLGDPDSEGAGMRVVLRDNNDRRLADIVLGRQRPDGYLYVRRSGEARSWLVRGFVPEVAEASNWMELDFLSLGRENIQETCVVPADGPGYCLLRSRLTSGTFDLPSPRGWRLVSRGAGDGVATVLARIRFRNARGFAEIRAPVMAQHRVTTVDGLEVTLFIHNEGGGYWARIVAVAHSDRARPAAVALNERADGWAFELSDLSVDRLMRPLSQIAFRPDASPQ